MKSSAYKQAMVQNDLPQPDPETVSRIADNLSRVRDKLAGAANRAGRTADEIRLIAVSKTHPPELVEAARRAGQQDFGENTVQDARGKLDTFAGENLIWHFIGHLQSNKARYIPGAFQWLHSADRLELVQKLERRCQSENTSLNVLIQINITGDPAKAGLAPEALPIFLEQILKEELRHVRLCGLMTIGPMTEEERALRHAFASLRELRDRSSKQFGLATFTELSMGMSSDYRDAILEGSTMVRVGSAIFGQRDYSR